MPELRTYDVGLDDRLEVAALALREDANILKAQALLSTQMSERLEAIAERLEKTVDGEYSA